MTESVRRRNSKWDLKEDPDHFPAETRQERTWSGRGGEFINERELKSEWHSAKGLSRHDSRWSDIEAKRMPRNEGNSRWSSSVEPSPRNRGIRNDEIDRRVYNEMSKTMMMDGDRSYSMSMSPGLDEWRQQNRSRSPKSGWRSHRSRSRSRSRSPPYDGFRRELEGSGDRRSGSRVSAPFCTAFAAGRCRQGSNCRFIHQDDHDYDGRRHSGSSPVNGGSKHVKGGFSRNANIEEQMNHSRDKISHGHENVYDGDLEKSEILRGNRSSGQCDEFLKGNSRRGSSYKYAHDGAPSDGQGRERDHDRKDADAPYGHDNRHESRRVNSKPCKFFAAGHCRHGENCRFSHEGTDRGSPERRFGDDYRRGHELDHEKRSWGGPKWSDTAPDIAHNGSDERLIKDKLGHNLGNVNRSWDGPKWSDITDNHNLSNENRSWEGPKWSDKVADSDVKLCGWGNDNNGDKLGVVESRTTERSFEMGQNLDNATRTSGGPLWNDEPVDRDMHKSPQWIGDNNGGSMGFRESVASGKFLASESMLSSGAKVQYPCFDNEDMGHNQDLKFRNLNEINLPTTDEQNISQGVSGQLHSSINVNGQSQQVLPTPALNPNERVQQIVSSPSSNQYYKKMVQDFVDPRLMAQEEPIKKPDLVDPRLMSQQVSSGSPLSQSIPSQEQVAQLTNISASLAQILANGQHLPQLYAALNPSASGLMPSHTNSAGPPEVVAPSIQPNQTTQYQKQYDPISDSIDQDKAADEDSQSPLENNRPYISADPNGGDALNVNGSLGDKVHESHELKQPEQVMDQNAADDVKKEQHTGHSGQVDTEGQIDEEGKKSKDPKGMRVFKFALVEFVKELLKPTWKEGQMSKEAHKTIVKKVVDKVTGTIQGGQIPQTQEKIDHYLSYSKPKLTKLVQAYVEKYLKT